MRKGTARRCSLKAWAVSPAAGILSNVSCSGSGAPEAVNWSRQVRVAGERVCSRSQHQETGQLPALPCLTSRGDGDMPGMEEIRQERGKQTKVDLGSSQM